MPTLGNVYSASAACAVAGNVATAPEKVTRNNPFLRIEPINSLLYVFLSFVNITELLHMLRDYYIIEISNVKADSLCFFLHFS